MKMTLKRKLIYSFILIAFIFTINTMITIYFSKKTNDSYEYLLNGISQLSNIAQKLQTEIETETSTYRGYLLYGDGQYKDQFRVASERIDKLIEQGKEIATLQEIIDRLEEIETLNKQFVETATPIMDLVRLERDKALKQGLQEIPPINSAIQIKISDMTNYLNELNEQESAENQKRATASITQAIILSTIAFIIAIVSGTYISNNISKPILLVRNQMNAIARGDLTNEKLAAKTKDEIGELITATNTMSEQMKTVISKINEVSEIVSSHSEELAQSAHEVTASAEQIAATMDELAAGSENQANSSTDLSNAMVEFSANIQEANENGEYAEEQSTKMLEMTNVGSQLMTDSTKQMHKIDEIVKASVFNLQKLNEQSNEISKLVTVIKDIANQTNLLALNASIEAARAGEHGKGFSVVANEVGKLAEQTASSVGEITSIVESIQNGFFVVTESLQEGYREVEVGTEKIETTGNTFKDISEGITEVGKLIKNISANLEEVAATSQEMSSSVQEIAATAEESAAGVEETAASIQHTNGTLEEIANGSKQLAELAEELNELISKFKV